MCDTGPDVSINSMKLPAMAICVHKCEMLVLPRRRCVVCPPLISDGTQYGIILQIQTYEWRKTSYWGKVNNTIASIKLNVILYLNTQQRHSKWLKHFLSLLVTVIEYNGGKYNINILESHTDSMRLIFGDFHFGEIMAYVRVMLFYAFCEWTIKLLFWNTDPKVTVSLTCRSPWLMLTNIRGISWQQEAPNTPSISSLVFVTSACFQPWSYNSPKDLRKI